jgi:hypothetical protein
MGAVGEITYQILLKNNDKTSLSLTPLRIPLLNNIYKTDKMKKILIIAFLPLLAVSFYGCDVQQSSGDYYTEDDGQQVEKGNPYGADSGHSAGYEWAAETGGGCSGNSDSFNEGCEEYYRQNSR